MAQKPALRHVLGQVRLQAGLSQSDLAKILGCAAVSVQKIEQGNLSLSEELATKAEEEIDVSAAWLLANDPTQPAVTPRGGTWTKNHFEFAQGTLASFTEDKPGGGKRFRYRRGSTILPPDDSEIAANALIALRKAKTVAVLDALFEGTKGLRQQGILFHRLDKMLKTFQEDFKTDEATLEKHQAEIEKARVAYDKIRKEISDGFYEQFWREERDSKG